MMSAQDAAPGTEAGMESVRDTVIEIWASVLPASDHQRSFFDQGGNSMRAIAFVMQLEERLGVSVPFFVLADPGGVEDIVRWIAANHQ